MTYGLIRGDAGGDGSLGAAVAGEASTRDLDLIRVGAISPAIGAGGAEGNGGRKGGNEEGEGAHIGLLGGNWSFCLRLEEAKMICGSGGLRLWKV